jgi:predicted ATP-grasp superfamily ATP-dependent carboligase
MPVQASDGIGYFSYMGALELDQRPELRAPTLICAFKGWNDAAESATHAVDFLADQWGAKQFGSIDPEDFFDFQVVRPTVRLVEGQTRKIEWPALTLSSAHLKEGKRDIVLLSGIEPNLRWKTFCATILDLARELGVELVVTFGALLADVPHTRPVPITGIAGDPDLAERLGFSQTRYEGPTGIVGVLHDTCARAGMPTASLWAPVPHYVAGVPSPKAALALLHTLEALIDVELDVSELEEESTEYERRLDEAVAAEPEVRLLVERLEQQMDENEISFRDLPSGDTIAREFQRFLRQRGNPDN